MERFAKSLGSTILRLRMTTVRPGIVPRAVFNERSKTFTRFFARITHQRVLIFLSGDVEENAKRVNIKLVATAPLVVGTDVEARFGGAENWFRGKVSFPTPHPRRLF
jgi:hypothetical protein